MSKTFVYADPHFFQYNIVKFKRYDGSPLRPWDDSDQMSEDMITWYNQIVSPEDRVYILGDVAMNRKALDRCLPRLPGQKVLVKGNHDMDKLSYYSKYFDDIRSVVVKKGFVLSHIPLHPDCLTTWGLNIHGHLHCNEVMSNDNKLEPTPDSRYKCVSVEHTGYVPVLLDEILTKAGVR